jgi:hypothetical protein
MRNLFIFILFGLSNCYSQNQPYYTGFENAVNNDTITTLLGSWRISHLIIDAETREYGLSPQSPNMFENYGNNISINPNGTFVSNYSAKCGNDCFTNTKGKYKIINDHYICFYLEEIIRSGDCSGNSKLNKDLGLFYYFKENNDFRLLKK